MKKLIWLVVLVVGFVAFAPSRAQATVIINEVMYDLSGADDGREWIELYNDGTTDVEMTLFFYPQLYFYLGIIVSIVALAMLSLLAFNQTRGRRKRDSSDGLPI